MFIKSCTHLLNLYSTIPTIVLIAFILNSTVKCFNFETNKVIIHNPTYSKNTNFGYTVAGYKYAGDSWILVGAPLTERQRFHGEPKNFKEGAVYRCRINVPDSCYVLPFDVKKDWKEVRDNYGIYYSENKTDQFLGATLAVADDTIMACAPNYRYVTRVMKQDEFRYEPTGTCFALKDRMRKFEEHSPCKNFMWGHHRQGYCQAGFSVAISNNDSSMFISGPGAWYWQGMVFSIDSSNKEIKNKYPLKSEDGNRDDSYRGYSMDIGYFDNDSNEDVIVSSPRGSNGKGFIEILDSKLKRLHLIDGEQFGSYFGASVLAVDLNNDRTFDIVVGAPMFKKDTENFDIGRVYVYLRHKNKKNFEFSRLVLNGYRAKSRFGTTLAKIGDVNDDGFQDIAIAAPYDGDENSGVVYIYHGSNEGLRVKPHQIIKGSEYGLKSFGYSLSGGIDLDENGYPDLIVGAYKSDAVAFIRSKPVIKTILITSTYPKVIDLDSKEMECEKNKSKFCLNIDFCVQYFGKAIPSSLNMGVSLELDIDKYKNSSLIRAVFDETLSHKNEFNFTFNHDQQKCFKKQVQIDKSIRDKFTPIKFRLNLSLPLETYRKELMPIFNSPEESSKVHHIRFLRNCGPDDICVPNLKVSASTLTKKYVYGSQSNIDLNIQIDNRKEDAFEAQCHITLPYGVDFVKAFLNRNNQLQQSSLTCSQVKNSNETKIICDIGNPMNSGQKKSFVIRVAPRNILTNLDALKFHINASSSNKEDKSTLFDNEKVLVVALEATPIIALIGKQYQEQVVYDSKQTKVKMISNETEIGPEIIHEYKLINKGPSRFLTSEVLISWQKVLKIKNKNRELLYLIEAPYTEGSIKCSIEKNLINPLNLSRNEYDKLRNPNKYYLDNENRNLFKRNLNEPLEENFLTENDVYLNELEEVNLNELNSNIDCATGMLRDSSFSGNTISASSSHVLSFIQTREYNFYCASLHCSVGSLATDESAIVRLRFRLWSRSLSRNPEVYKIKTFGLSTVTQIPYSKENLNLPKFQSSVQIETIAHPNERKHLFQQIDIRIIFLSVIAGLFLLTILVILLWCCGFFKRFEFQEMKDSTISEEELSNDVIDVSKECCKLQTSTSKETANLLSYNRENSNEDIDVDYKEKPVKFTNHSNSFNQMLIKNSERSILNSKQSNNTHKEILDQNINNMQTVDVASLYSTAKVNKNSNQHSENNQYKNANTYQNAYFVNASYSLNPKNMNKNLNYYQDEDELTLQQQKQTQFKCQTNESNLKYKSLEIHRNEDSNKIKNDKTNLFSASNNFCENNKVSASIKMKNNNNSSNHINETYTNKLPPVPKRTNKMSINNNSVSSAMNNDFVRSNSTFENHSNASHFVSNNKKLITNNNFTNNQTNNDNNSHSFTSNSSNFTYSPN